MSAVKKINSIILEQFGIQKVFKLVRYLEKKQKKLISLHVLANFINQSVLNKQFFFICFVKFGLVQFLKLLKTVKFVFNFFFVPSVVVSALRLVSRFSWVNLQLVIVYLNKTYFLNEVYSLIYLFSKPSRQIYISFAALRRLSVSRSAGQRQFVLNTVFGLLTHTEALQKSVGGTLLCLI